MGNKIVLQTFQYLFNHKSFPDLTIFWMGLQVIDAVDIQQVAEQTRVTNMSLRHLNRIFPPVFSHKNAAFAR